MKKILKNKKGFTLVELLAVIVVLAIIMVIATQQVNRTIKKARTNSFNETMQTVVKTSKLLISEGTLTTSELQSSLDYSKSEYDVLVTKSGTQWTITLEANSNGKFSNVNFSLMSGSDKITGYLYDSGSPKICTTIDDSGNLTSPTSCGNVYSTSSTSSTSS